MDGGQDFFVSAGEGELVEFSERQPATGNLRGWNNQSCGPGCQCDAVAGDGVFDDAEWFRCGDAKS